MQLPNIDIRELLWRLLLPVGTPDTPASQVAFTAALAVQRDACVVYDELCRRLCAEWRAINGRRQQVCASIAFVCLLRAAAIMLCMIFSWKQAMQISSNKDLTAVKKIPLMHDYVFSHYYVFGTATSHCMKTSRSLSMNFLCT